MLGSTRRSSRWPGTRLRQGPASHRCPIAGSRQVQLHWAAKPDSRSGGAKQSQVPTWPRENMQARGRSDEAHRPYPGRYATTGGGLIGHVPAVRDVSTSAGLVGSEKIRSDNAALLLGNEGIAV